MKAKTNKPKLVLEINSKFIDGDKSIHTIGKVTFMVTPPLDEDFWQFRVKVDKEQAIVGFPKFHSIGIGFALEDDWNTNLPSNYKAEQIFEHISHNKRFASISDETCIEAIKMVQKAANEFQKVQQETEDLFMVMNEPFLKDETTGKLITKKAFKDSCNINRRRRADIFVRTEHFTNEKTEIKKYKFVLLFGSLRDQYGSNGYKYKMSLYAESKDLAVNRFFYLIRMIAKYGEEQTLGTQLDSRFETFNVAKEENGFVRGYKIPIAI